MSAVWDPACFRHKLPREIQSRHVLRSFSQLFLKYQLFVFCHNARKGALAACWGNFLFLLLIVPNKITICSWNKSMHTNTQPYAGDVVSCSAEGRVFWTGMFRKQGQPLISSEPSRFPLRWRVVFLHLFRRSHCTDVSPLSGVLFLSANKCLDISLITQLMWSPLTMLFAWKTHSFAECAIWSMHTEGITVVLSSWKQRAASGRRTDVLLHTAWDPVSEALPIQIHLWNGQEALHQIWSP